MSEYHASYLIIQHLLILCAGQQTSREKREGEHLWMNCHPYPGASQHNQLLQGSVSVPAVCALQCQLPSQAPFLSPKGVLLADLFLAALCWAQTEEGLSLSLAVTLGYSSASPNHARAKARESPCVSQSSDILSLTLPSGCTNYLFPARNKHKWEITALWITSLNFPPQISSARGITVLNTGGTGNRHALSGRV